MEIDANTEATLRLQQCLQQFIDHVDTLRLEDDPSGDGFTREFRGLRELAMKMREDNSHPANEGKKPHNIRKNRYKDILPFDETRVSLDEVEGEEGSDYINADFVQGLQGANCYIASQGPLPATVNDFWRMIWKYEVKVVAMACRLVEMGKRKCEQYWPQELGESQDYGDIHVTLEEESKLAEHCTRRLLRAECGGAAVSVTQYHYTGWPDHDIPNDFDVILEMMAEMRSIRYKDPHKSPIVVHCSAGCGRTGTICAIDYAWDVLKTGRLEESFSLYEIVKKMREERQSMIQAPEQYMMAHITVQQLFMKHLDMMEDHTYGNVTFGKDEAEEDVDTKSETSSLGGQYHGRRKESILELDISNTLSHYGGVATDADITPTAGPGTTHSKPKMEPSDSEKVPDPSHRDSPQAISPLVKQMRSVYEVQKIENIPVTTSVTSEKTKLVKTPSVEDKARVASQDSLANSTTPTGNVHVSNVQQAGKHVTVLSIGGSPNTNKYPLSKSTSEPATNNKTPSTDPSRSKSLAAQKYNTAPGMLQPHVLEANMTTTVESDYTSVGQSQFFTGKSPTTKTSNGQSHFYSVERPVVPDKSQPPEPEGGMAAMYAQVERTRAPSQNGAQPHTESTYESVQVTRQGSLKAVPPIPSRGYQEEPPAPSQSQNTEPDRGSGDMNTMGKKNQLTNAIKSLFTVNKTIPMSTSDHVVPSDIPGFKQRIGRRPAGPKTQPAFWSQKH